MKRRSVLCSVPAVLGAFLLDPRAHDAPPAAGVADEFPAQDPDLVREVVSVSHFSLDRVRALVDKQPELAKAAWDWGFGDWETALGAASHTGNHEIAGYLIENGARPDLFTAAMSGNLQAVRAFVEAVPGVQRLPGPHGITLRRHAELGGERARSVLAYLDELGGADDGPADRPLPIDRNAYLGSYVFGAGPADRFEVTLGRRDALMLQRGTGTPRQMFHQGGHVFHPAGAPSARIRFVVDGEEVRALEVRNPGLVVTGIRS